MAGTKGLVQRSPSMVYIMVPDVSSEHDVVTSARIACRLAYQRGLMPVYPPLYCYPFLVPEEQQKEIKKISRWWLRRVSRVWISFPGDPDDWRLDGFSYEFLERNREPRNQYLPVSALHRVGEEYIPLAMQPHEVDTLLMENATACMAMAGGF